MRIVVKTTTSGGVLDLLCPHICRGCGALGATLCERCKKNLLSERVEICPLCQQKLDSGIKPCPDCGLPFERVFVGGWRTGVLAKLIKEYKYQAVRANGRVLTELSDAVVPNCTALKSVVVVPLPTIGRHVRARGIDHTARLSRRLARRRGWEVKQILGRAADTVQVGAKAAKRIQQAKQAYTVIGKVDPDQTYLLLDDIWTTGASLISAAKALRAAGAIKIYALVLAIGKPKSAARE